MKKFLTTALLGIIILSSVFYAPVYAATNPQGAGQGRTDSRNVNDYSTSNWDRFQFNYQFNSGPNTNSTFGAPTHTNTAGSNPMQDNIRRNKDAAHLPPGYGVFSGEVPTNASSLLHTADSKASASNNTFNGTASVNYYGNSTGVMPSTSVMQTPDAAGGSSNVTVSQQTNNNSTNLPPSNSGSSSSNQQSGNNNATITEPAFYNDGSIGFLSIPSIYTYVPVFEGETQANMKLGAAHFEFTSAWDGNVGLAGHNRGAADFFKGVKDLQIGDLITYETLYGIRVYQVYLKEIIKDTDFSYLGPSRENNITLITCVIDTPDKRWAVQAKEIRCKRAEKV